MNWYLNIRPSEHISQGDLFFNCPIFKADPSAIINVLTSQEAQEIPIVCETYNVVVLSQACDLVYDTDTGRTPVRDVLVAITEDINDINTGKSKRKDLITKIHAGNIPNLHLISNYEGDEYIPPMNYQVVDFSSPLSIPYDVLMTFREMQGHRLRLNTPHREALNNRYGSYIARVGLPNDDFIPRQDVIAALRKD